MESKTACKASFCAVLNVLRKYWYPVVICLIFSVGILSRLEGLLAREMWLDETFLVSNFKENSGVMWVFKPLQHNQIAPPIFLFCTKAVTLFFGENEFSFRLIPFIAGIFSIFVFYYLSKIVLKTKPAIILANFLFSINFLLIRYTSEFKQYGTDILIFMLVLIWLSKAPKLQNPDFKTILKYSLLFLILFLTSQPVIFLLFGFILYNALSCIKQNRTDFFGLFKIISVSFIPLIFIFAYKLAMPEDIVYTMQNYWENQILGFISFNNVKDVLFANYEFFTFGAEYMAFFVPFVLIGFFVFVFKKTTLSKIFLFSLAGALLASILHLYPFVSRLILFLLPFEILFIAQCFDFKIAHKKMRIIFSSIVIILVMTTLLLFQAKIICKNRIKTLVGFNHSVYSKCYLKHSVATCLNVLS